MELGYGVGKISASCLVGRNNQKRDNNGSPFCQYNRLVVPSSRLSTVGSRSFSVSGPRIWNALLEDVVSAPSLSTFRRRLKSSSSVEA